MRVALVGNSAQNAYLLAKFLRQWTDVEAFAIYEANEGSLRLPPWEDAEYPPDTGEKLAAAIKARSTRLHLPLASPWEQPGWAIPYDMRAQPAALPMPAHLSDIERRTLRKDAHVLQAAPLVLDLARQVDLVVLLGPWAAYGAILPRHSYVTVEHGTMRSVPELTLSAQRVLAIAYRHAAYNVITNADCSRAAESLNLDPARYGFIPHPIQTDVFAPLPEPTTDVAALRADLQQCPDGETARLVLLAPARQTAPGDLGSKDNAHIFRAFARYVAEAEPAGAPRAVLHALAHDKGEAAMRALVQELGIAGRVRWFPLQPKRTLLRYYQAADVVLDQFSAEVGSYGAVTVEALACGKPCITWVDPARHAWCAEVCPTPPVANALTVEEIYGHLLRYARVPMTIVRDGATGRRWVEQWHSAPRVARLWAELCGQVARRSWKWTGPAPDVPNAANVPVTNAPEPAREAVFA